MDSKIPREHAWTCHDMHAYIVCVLHLLRLTNWSVDDTQYLQYEISAPLTYISAFFVDMSSKENIWQRHWRVWLLFECVAHWKTITDLGGVSVKAPLEHNTGNFQSWMTCICIPDKRLMFLGVCVKGFVGILHSVAMRKC